MTDSQHRVAARAADDTAFRAAIRDVPDFPSPGIVFKDISPLLADAELFARTTDAMASPFQREDISHVVGIESRGFIFGAPIAQHLGAGFVPARKRGKLPASTVSIEYALEYGTACLEIHADALPRGARVLLVDDVLATGGTAGAACALLEQVGATVVGCSFLLALSFLAGPASLAGRRVSCLVTY
jgi:adenine phosphoribosyltransferase